MNNLPSCPDKRLYFFVFILVSLFLALAFLFKYKSFLSNFPNYRGYPTQSERENQVIQEENKTQTNPIQIKDRFLKQQKEGKPSHRICYMNSCVLVSGEGVDSCSQNSDCVKDEE